MRRKIPSTTALSCFESAARHQSFTKAADELAVTQSAICRQIGLLEDFLGLKLFRRSRRGVVLTDAGVNYSRSITARLDDVERDTLEIMAKGGQGLTLELGVVPTFATKWLLPRLSSFRAAHPAIKINFTARTRPFLFDETHFDAAIHAGNTAWPGTKRLFLMRESLIPVCSPSLIGPQTVLSDRDWQSFTLLQQSTRPYCWRDWFSSQGKRIDGDMSGPRFELFSMLAQAAKYGGGIALIPRVLVEEELESGVLVVVSTHQYLSDRSYSLIYPEWNADNVGLAAFRSWLETEATTYRQLNHLGFDLQVESS